MFSLLKILYYIEQSSKDALNSTPYTLNTYVHNSDDWKHYKTFNFFAKLAESLVNTQEIKFYCAVEFMDR